MENFHVCPICQSDLFKSEGFEKVYQCSVHSEHNFIINGNILLWTPMIQSEGEYVYIRKYSSENDKYSEVFDAETTENLLSIIQTQNETMREMIAEYTSLGEYVKALESKLEAHKEASANADVTLFGRPVIGANKTKSGIILKP